MCMLPDPIFILMLFNLTVLFVNPRAFLHTILVVALVCGPVRGEGSPSVFLAVFEAAYVYVAVFLVGVNTFAIKHSLSKSAFIFVSVGACESSLSVFLAIYEEARILVSIWESDGSLPIPHPLYQSTLILTLSLLPKYPNQNRLLISPHYIIRIIIHTPINII